MKREHPAEIGAWQGAVSEVVGELPDEIAQLHPPPRRCTCMTSEEHPGEGRYVWRQGRVSYEAMVPVDGVVVLGMFWDKEILWIWEEPAGEA